ncbi:MAG TPA: SRPBCC domain-containing protein [Jiangellaceae bacterium]|nr:SRPBCC domain-containing protein [Jiangellaceae bacterium]
MTLDHGTHVEQWRQGWSQRDHGEFVRQHRVNAVGWESRVVNGPPARRVLELTCVLDAPRERIFRTLTEPAELRKWWGPHGFTTPETELDLTVGGGYRFTMQPPDGDLFHLSGEFLEIDPPSRLVYTFRWEEPDPDDRETVVAMSLQPVGDATKVSLSQGEFATEARIALHRSGWTDSFEKLRELIDSGA